MKKKSNENVYIGGLVINPDFQGQGIARKAMMIVLEKFKNVKRIDLVTHPDNIMAINLYQSLGFITESRKENYYGDSEPRIIMARILKCDRKTAIAFLRSHFYWYENIVKKYYEGWT